MGLLSDADNRAMVQALGGGDTAIYLPEGGKAPDDNVTLSIILDNEPVLSQIDEYTSIETRKRVARVASADLTGTPKDGTLTIGGTAYMILEAEDDGEGMTTLTLGAV